MEGERFVRKERTPRLGDVYVVDPSGLYAGQKGLRPCVVFQNNVGNKNCNKIVVLPITSAPKKKHQATHVRIGTEDTGLHKESVVLCEVPMHVDKDCLKNFLFRMPDSYMEEIAIGSILASSAISYIRAEKIPVVLKAAKGFCDIHTD